MLFTQTTPAPFRAEPGLPVLVMLGSDDDAVFKELLAQASTGARVYVLVSPTWGTDVPIDPQLLHASKVLIRRIPELPASAIHTARGARLWLGGPWSLRLDDAQAAAFRQVFLRLFWHEATEEAWTAGGKQPRWRVAGERPFDVPEVSRNASVRLASDARLEMDKRGALVHLTGGSIPDVAPRKLWFPAGGDHHDGIAKLVQSESEVVWDDRGLPDMVVRDQGGEVLLPGTRARLRIMLTPGQTSDATRILEAQARWTFGVDLRIGESSLRSASFWLSGEKKARALETEQTIPIADVLATSLRTVPETAPTTWPVAQPLALSVRYRWTVVPPKLPAGTVEDPLVGQWRKVDEDWQSRIAQARQVLETAEENQGRIAKTLSRLASALLGFGRTHKGLLEHVAAMEKARPSSAGPSSAPAMLSELAKIEEQARKLQSDIDEAERKEQEDLEREKQQATWQARVDEAKGKLPMRRDELAEAEKRRESFDEELGTIDAEMKAADKDAKKDLYAQQQKLSDEVKRAKRDVNRLRGEISSLEEQAAEKFEFRPPANPAMRPKQTAGRFVPPTSNARPTSTVPDQALPEVGALRILKNQRYLVIKTWEELAAGEQAASRLSANLVAPENVL